MSQLVFICIYSIVGLGLMLLVGFTGQISIGHAAFFLLGAYTSASLVPVIASAVASWLVMRQIMHQSFLLIPNVPSAVSVEMIGQTMAIGLVCAFFSIVLIIAVAYSERIFQRITWLRGSLRFVIGAVLVGCLGLLTPTVLGSGHGAMQLLLLSSPTWLMLATTIVLKTLASAITIGAGFRGGLFFASLMLGSMIGQRWRPWVRLRTQPSCRLPE